MCRRISDGSRLNSYYDAISARGCPSYSLMYAKSELKTPIVLIINESILDSKILLALLGALDTCNKPIFPEWSGCGVWFRINIAHENNKNDGENPTRDELTGAEHNINSELLAMEWRRISTILGFCCPDQWSAGLG
ncbi:hypothetical protein RRG08_010563 [Elysia crispata]|uniref:Uncharacterized protein n=1 Tax=Elysia crispata TaxID=231223 RepID=A0AAE1DMJ8_9GAST|nr:hypothetical protein RRG08_010563 [Elysia crispata]